MGAGEALTADLTEDEFRAEALDFLNSVAHPRRQAEWAHGSDCLGLFSNRTAEKTLHEVRAAQRWRATCYDEGFGWISGPIEYGGRGLPAGFERLWESLEGGFDTPSVNVFRVGLGNVAPTILRHGSDVAKDRHLRSMHRGEVIACQLFSEPNAGSDLAGLETKATSYGDEWRITGQKVWTSGAQYCDIGEIICRTDASAPKHRGLTAFLIDMHAPGVEVRPLRQMTGGAEFNEVFLTDVAVSDDYRLGKVNDGWGVAITTLMNERAGNPETPVSVAQLIALLKHMGRNSDLGLRQRLASIWINDALARFTDLRIVEKLNAGQVPGPEMSIGKLSMTNNLMRMSEFVGEVLGPSLVADCSEWGTFAWSELVLSVPGYRVAGGTDEIMRNIIAERVLGLPRG